MFDYCGDIDASHEDFEGLLSKVVQETFPTANCKVCIRQTKAMLHPKISISIMDGPTCADLAAAIPLLSEIQNGARWAYGGKVLPALSWWVRAHPKSTHLKYSKIVWNQMQQEDPTLRDCNPNWAAPPRSRPYSVAKHKQRLSDYLENLHPARSSPTMEKIVRGDSGSIVQLAMEQRRNDMAIAIPLATVVGAVPRPPNRGRL